jgi:hypothetical protein
MRPGGVMAMVRWARLRAGRGVILALGVCAVTACSQERGRPPVARMSVEPRYIPVNAESVVLLDGRRSCDEIDHPETCDKTAEGETGPPSTCPGGVTFHWSLDTTATPVGGADAWNQPYLEVRVAPSRPITVTLKVTDCDQNTVTTKSQIGVTLPYPETEPDAGVP